MMNPDRVLITPFLCLGRVGGVTFPTTFFLACKPASGEAAVVEEPPSMGGGVGEMSLAGTAYLTMDN